MCHPFWDDTRGNWSGTRNVEVRGEIHAKRVISFGRAKVNFNILIWENTKFRVLPRSSTPIVTFASYATVIA